MLKIAIQQFFRARLADTNSAQSTDWAAERRYWHERWSELMVTRFGVAVADSHNDNANLPSRELIGRIQTLSKSKPDVFFATGYRGVVHYLEELCEFGFDPSRFSRALEFGVGLGRLIRHMTPFTMELHGCDITPEVVAFTRNAFAPRVRVIANHAQPPLDLPRCQFRFCLRQFCVYAYSDRFGLHLGQ